MAPPPEQRGPHRDQPCPHRFQSVAGCQREGCREGTHDDPGFNERMTPLSTEFESEMFDGRGDAGDAPGKKHWPKVMIHVAGAKYGGVPRSIRRGKRIVGMVFVGNGSRFELQDPDRQRRCYGASMTNWVSGGHGRHHYKCPVSGCSVRNSTAVRVGS